MSSLAGQPGLPRVKTAWAPSLNEASQHRLRAQADCNRVLRCQMRQRLRK